MKIVIAARLASPICTPRSTPRWASTRPKNSTLRTTAPCPLPTRANRCARNCSLSPSLEQSSSPGTRGGVRPDFLATSCVPLLAGELPRNSALLADRGTASGFRQAVPRWQFLASSGTRNTYRRQKNLPHTAGRPAGKITRNYGIMPPGLPPTARDEPTESAATGFDDGEIALPCDGEFHPASGVRRHGGVCRLASDVRFGASTAVGEISIFCSSSSAEKRWSSRRPRMPRHAASKTGVP